MCYGLPQHSIPALLEFLSTQRIYTVVKVGSCMDQGPASEVTHLRLYQSPTLPVFLQKTVGGRAKEQGDSVHRVTE